MTFVFSGFSENRTGEYWRVTLAAFILQMNYPSRRTKSTSFVVHGLVRLV